MAKEVAGTLVSVLDNPLMRAIQDRRTDLRDTIQKVQGFWNYDLFSRKPGPAYRDGVFVGTDLDLACFLYALVDRKAVIKLPTYQALRARTKTEGQMLSSKHNRHGQILSLVSNQHTFVFSVRLMDMNVMTTGKVGDYRNFAITDFTGDWYDGWHVIEFLPTAKENSFITDNDLWSGNRISFKNFVHPNRWTSFYGQYYFITKALIARLKDECKFIRALIKDMEAHGVKWPDHGDGARKEWPQTTKEAGKKIKVSAFEVEIDLPDPVGSYLGAAFTTENMVHKQEILDTYRRAVAQLQFMTRATELAFYKHGSGKLPAWIKNAEWQEGYVQKGKRTKWDRLVLFQPQVGQVGVSLRKRLYEKTEEVSHSY